MFGKLFLLGLIALAQSRPQDEELVPAVAKCPSGESNYLIPNERDCSKFYICGVGRNLREGVCEPGLEFSVELQRCADPLIAKCNCNTETTTTTTTPAPLPEEDRVIIYLPNGCPEDNDVHKLLPHEERCEYFYYCVNGEKVLRECAQGTYFVYEEQTCDSIWNVNCISNGTTTPRPTTTTTKAVEEESREITYLPNGCPADGSYLLLPHETICRKFYYCVHGDKVERECGAGTVFNPVIMNCDHAFNVDCEDVVTECICDGSDEECDGSTTTPIPASGEQSNEKEVSTEKPFESGSGENNGSEENSESSEESEEKDESDVIGKSEEKDESSGNQESGEKSEEGSGEEEENVTTSKPEPTEDYKSDENNESGEDSNKSCENRDSDENNSNGCDCENSDEEEDLRCKEDCHVPFWAHETDCDKFWRCVGEERVLGVCSEGLHFNEETQTCDFICNVGCKRNHVQSTALREGLKLYLPWNKVDDLFRDNPKMAMKFLKNHK